MARADDLGELFDADVIVAEWAGVGAVVGLTDEEVASVADVGSSRLSEFAAGRACARFALAELGFPHASLPRLPDRRVGWPTGVGGSISHSRASGPGQQTAEGYYLAAVARSEDLSGRTLGIDVEQLGRATQRIERHVCTTEELAAMSALGDPVQRDLVTTAIFSAKEALYKAQFELTQAWLGFSDVAITWDDPLDRQTWAPDAPTPLVRWGSAHLVRTGADQADIAWPVRVGATVRGASVITSAMTRANAGRGDDQIEPER